TFRGLLSPPAGGGAQRFTGRISMMLDLSDPLVRVSTADALHALGVPLLLDQGHPVSPTGAVADLYALLDSGARGTSVTINTYRLPAGASSSPGATLGLQGGLTIAGALPGADYYYAPHQGFVKWQVCDG